MSKKKFKFRLDPLLKIREYKEKEKQKAHAVAVEQVYKQRNLIGDIDHKRLNTLDDNRAVLVGNISVAEALIYSRYLLKLKRDRLSCSELLNALDKVAENKRLELVEAAKERKKFESLKDNLKEKFLKEAEKENQKELDEIATVRFNRKNK